LVVSPYGLFVVELKDWSGWIFANERDAYWTSVYFRRKYRFQNPLRQNFGHVKALQELLGIDSSAIHSVVVFRGRFSFKTPVPEGILFHRYAHWITDKRAVLLDQAQLDASLDLLKAKAVRGWFAAQRHTESVRARYADDATCPKCGGDLVIRPARRGSVPESQFLGCGNYPRGKYTRSVAAS
jgi:hypothetical protein